MAISDVTNNRAAVDMRRRSDFDLYRTLQQPQATKIFKTEIIERHTYDKHPQSATILNKACISIGNDGEIKRTPFDNGIPSGLLHRSQIVGPSASYIQYKQNDELRKLSAFPYSSTSGKSVELQPRTIDLQFHPRSHVDGKALDPSFASGRVTVRNSISSFDETVSSYPSRFVSSEAPPARPRHAEPVFTAQQAPPAPRAPSRERMCDAEVRLHAADAHTHSSRGTYVVQRVSDAEVWNSSVGAGGRAPPAAAPASVPAYYSSWPDARRTLARSMEARQAGAAPAPRVLPLTVSVAAPYPRAVGALVSPRPAAARCYAYAPAAQAAQVYKERQYC